MSHTNLTIYDRRVIHNTLGSSYKILATGIAEALLSPAASVEEWSSIIRPGVVCLVEDKDKEQFEIVVINIDKGVLFWKQHIDNHLVCDRRRRWIFVLKSGFRKLCVNFTDDIEADKFSLVFYDLFPKLRSFDGKIPYYVSNRNIVIRNKIDGKVTTLNRSENSGEGLQKDEFANIKEDNIQKFVKIAKLPKNVLQNSSKADEIYDFYLENRVELDEMFEDSAAFSLYSKVHNLDLSINKPKSKSKASRKSGTGNSHPSLPELPLPDNFLCAPPTQFSQTESESKHSSSEDNLQFRKTSDESRSLNARITSAPPLPPRVTILRGSPKIPRKSSTLAQNHEMLSKIYANDMSHSESESDKGETDSKQSNIHYSKTNSAKRNEREQVFETPIQNHRHRNLMEGLTQIDKQSYHHPPNPLTKNYPKLPRRKNTISKDKNNYQHVSSNSEIKTDEDFKGSTECTTQFHKGDNCSEPTNTIQENAKRPKNKAMTLPRLPTEETHFDDKPSPLPSIVKSSQQRHISLPPPPPSVCLPLPPVSPSSREEFRDDPSNNTAERRSSLLDQIRNPGFRLRKMEKSKTIACEHKDFSVKDGESSISSLLVGAMKNIRGFKGNPGLYNLEDEAYRCWDSSDSN